MDDTTVTVILVTVILGIFLIGAIVRCLILRRSSLLPVKSIYPLPMTNFIFSAGSSSNPHPPSDDNADNDKDISTRITVPQGTYPSSVPLALIVPWTMRSTSSIIDMEWKKLQDIQFDTPTTSKSKEPKHNSVTRAETIRIPMGEEDTTTTTLDRSTVWEKASFGTPLQSSQLQPLLVDILQRMEEAQTLLTVSPSSSSGSSSSSSSIHTNLLTMIKVDVERTSFFGLDNSKNTSTTATTNSTARYQHYLTTILLAWSYRHPKLRYIQALSIIGSVILQVYVPVDYFNHPYDSYPQDSNASDKTVRQPSLTILPATTTTNIRTDLFSVPYQLCKCLLVFEYVITSYLGDLLLPSSHTGLYHGEVRHMSAILEILAYWDPLLHIKLQDLCIDPELWTTGYLTTLGLNNITNFEEAVGLLDTIIICGHREKIEKSEMLYPDYYRHSPRRDSRLPLFITVAIMLNYRSHFLNIQDTNESLRILQSMKQGENCHWGNIRYLAILLWIYSGSLLGAYAPHSLVFRVPHLTNDPELNLYNDESIVRSSQIPDRSLSNSSMESFSGIIDGSYNDEEAQIMLAEAIEIPSSISSTTTTITITTENNNGKTLPPSKKKRIRSEEEKHTLRILHHVQRNLHHIWTVPLDSQASSTVPVSVSRTVPETSSPTVDDRTDSRTALLLSTDNNNLSLSTPHPTNTVMNRNYIVPIVTLYDIVTLLLPLTVFSSSSTHGNVINSLSTPGSKITYINFLPSSSINASFSISQRILNNIIDRNLQEMTARNSSIGSLSPDVIQYVVDQGQVIDIALNRLFPLLDVSSSSKHVSEGSNLSPTIENNSNNGYFPLDYHEVLGYKTSLPLTDLCYYTQTKYYHENIPRTNELLRHHTLTYASSILQRKQTLMVIMLHPDIPFLGIRLLRDLLWRNGIPYVCGIRMNTIKN